MAIGSGVRAELGRSSAAAILQGGISGAQSIGRGIEQLGEGIGSRLDKREGKKEQAKADQAFLKAFGTLTETDSGQDLLTGLGIDPDTFDPAEFGVKGTKELLS